MTAKKNDPIMSADGSGIAAKWRHGVTFDAAVGSTFNVPVMPDLATAHTLKRHDFAEMDAAGLVIRVQLVARYPDRNYWRLSRDVPIEWLHGRNSYFCHPDDDTGPQNPRGMVAAIDELLNRHPSQDDATWLHVMRGYYQKRADME